MANLMNLMILKLESVILDECHYMNDPQRGTVWEETIIHCPTRTQIIALSAAIANADHSELVRKSSWAHSTN